MKRQFSTNPDSVARRFRAHTRDKTPAFRVACKLRNRRKRLLAAALRVVGKQEQILPCI